MRRTPIRGRRSPLANRSSLRPTAIARAPFERRSKMGNVRTAYRGVEYDSKLEADYAARLDLMRQALDQHKRVVGWERQVRVHLDVCGSHVCDYLVDFVVAYADERVEWVELKGKDTERSVIKVALFRALFPERRLIVVRRVK